MIASKGFPSFRVWAICGAVLGGSMIADSSLAQTADAVPAGSSPAAQPLQGQWEEIDQRFVFLTVELSSVEASLKAVNRALVAAGRDQASAQQRAANYADGNARMDRQGGTPMAWQDFYGKTALDFYYHSAARIHAEGQSNARLDAQFQGQQLTSVNRPPQFDYIYRANSDAEARANNDAANVGKQIDKLLSRRRELENEQSALWFRIALRGVSSRALDDKALYRYQLHSPPTDSESQAHFAAVSAGCDFMRTVNLLVKQAQPALEGDQQAVYRQLVAAMDSSRDGLRGTLLNLPMLANLLNDPTSELGRFNAAGKRLDDLAQNMVDASRLAVDGDSANDDQRKDAFRSQVQQAIMDFASTVLTADDALSAAATAWNIEPDQSRPFPASSKQLIVVQGGSAAGTSPEVEAVNLPNQPAAAPDTKSIAAERNRLAGLDSRPLRGTVTDDDITLSQTDKPYVIDGTYQPSRTHPETDHLTIDVSPGVEIRGGTFSLKIADKGMKQSFLNLNGVKDNPIILRNVEIDQPLDSAFNASYVIFDHCTFQKSGPWWVSEHSSKWRMQHCLLYNCTFPGLSQTDYGFNLFDCTFIGMTFPEIEHNDSDKPFDYMTLLRKEWDTIKLCSFVDCTVPPTVFWCSENSNYYHCSFLPGPAFNAETPTRILAYVAGTEGEGPDQINQDNLPLRAALTIRLHDEPFGVSRWPANCPVPEVRFDGRIAAVILNSAEN